MNDPAPETKTHVPWPLAALATWLLPGLGHWLIGERQRGAIVGITLVGMFLVGLIVGGIDVVDQRRDPLWFAGQVMIGPLGVGVAFYHRHLDRVGRPSPPPPAPAYEVSVGRINELGTLYCTLAGVLNLMVILDAAGRADQVGRSRKQPLGGRPQRT